MARFVGGRKAVWRGAAPRDLPRPTSHRPPAAIILPTSTPGDLPETALEKSLEVGVEKRLKNLPRFPRDAPIRSGRFMEKNTKTPSKDWSALDRLGNELAKLRATLDRIDAENKRHCVLVERYSEALRTARK